MPPDAVSVTVLSDESSLTDEEEFTASVRLLETAVRFRAGVVLPSPATRSAPLAVALPLSVALACELYDPSATPIPTRPLSAAAAPAAVEKLFSLSAPMATVCACTLPASVALETELACPYAAAAEGVPGPMAEGFRLRVLEMLAFC